MPQKLKPQAAAKPPPYKLLRHALPTDSAEEPDLIHAYRNRKGIFSSEIVWTMEEVQYLAVLFLSMTIPVPGRPRLIGQTIWLIDRWSNLSRLRRRFYKLLIQRADRLTVPKLHPLDLVHPTYFAADAPAVWKLARFFPVLGARKPCSCSDPPAGDGYRPDSGLENPS